jgi:hypothetical protein
VDPPRHQLMATLHTQLRLQLPSTPTTTRPSAPIAVESGDVERKKGKGRCDGVDGKAQKLQPTDGR